MVSKTPDAPADADIPLINRFVRKPLRLEHAVTAECLVANDRLDRDNERFHPALLEKFGGCYPAGRCSWITPRRVEVVERSSARAGTETDRYGTTLLSGAFYFPRRPHHADLIADIEDGLVNDVSIGFRAKRLITKEPSPGGRSVAEYVDDEAAEPLEVSLVWIGSQRGARVKAAAEAEPGAADELALPGRPTRWQAGCQTISAGCCGH